MAPRAGAVTVAANAVAAVAAGLTAAGPAAQLAVSVSSSGTSPTAKPSEGANSGPIESVLVFLFLKFIFLIEPNYSSSSHPMMLEETRMRRNANMLRIDGMNGRSFYTCFQRFSEMKGNSSLYERQAQRKTVSRIP